MELGPDWHSGLIIIAGLLIQNPWQTLTGCLGTTVSALTALILGQDSPVLSSALGSIFSKWDLPIFTLPFNVTVSLYLAATGRYNLFFPTTSIQPVTSVPNSTWSELHTQLAFTPRCLTKVKKKCCHTTQIKYQQPVERKIKSYRQKEASAETWEELKMANELQEGYQNPIILGFAIDDNPGVHSKSCLTALTWKSYREKIETHQAQQQRLTWSESCHGGQR
ncbi:hypothetical protein Y1Q_0009709 [Alligator mississippiensis]|uniref:Uncharacterized protein n=1 Tax=Alligator mississippiensis TaxID=8496 RepID=A0A151MWH6_ALLMI|nr:hypothetical protein Y1Q_0009709 [Alligator mississippiensis]